MKEWWKWLPSNFSVDVILGHRRGRAGRVQWTLFRRGRLNSIIGSGWTGGWWMVHLLVRVATEGSIFNSRRWRPIGCCCPRSPILLLLLLRIRCQGYVLLPLDDDASKFSSSAWPAPHALKQTLQSIPPIFFIAKAMTFVENTITWRPSQCVLKEQKHCRDNLKN